MKTLNRNRSKDKILAITMIKRVGILTKAMIMKGKETLTIMVTIEKKETTTVVIMMNRSKMQTLMITKIQKKGAATTTVIMAKQKAITTVTAIKNQLRAIRKKNQDYRLLKRKNLATVG